MVRTIITGLSLCWALWASGQQFGALLSTTQADQFMELRTDAGRWRVEVIDSHVVKVAFWPGGVERPVISKAVVPGAGSPPPVTYTHKRRKRILSWGDYEVTYDLRHEQLTLAEGRQTLASAYGYDDEDSLEVLAFGLGAGEQLYGGGFRALPMNRVGYRLPLYNAPQYGYGLGWEGSNFSIPTFVSSKGYALFVDNPAKGWADLGVEQPDQVRFEMAGGPMIFYWVLGDTPAEIVAHYTAITGRQPLPPKWALGNFASRFGYETEAEARAVVDRFLQDSIPLDAIIIDLYWFGKGVHDSFNMGNLRWDREAWPDPEGMIADFAAQDIKTILITEPFILQESYNYDNAVGLGLLATDSSDAPFVIEEFWFGPAGLLDIFKPAARTWFWEQYARQVQKGVAGWWGDLGEPEKHPSGIFHVNGPADIVHNAYGHWWSELLFTNYQKHYPDQRLFHLNRSGFAGSPRFAGYPWSGDVGRNWSGFEAQLPIMLGMAWCGVPYMHSDLGGFAMGEQDPELYTRWLQMGVFNPIYRPHAGGDIPSEPVFWDDTTKARAREAIRLRYQLLPYNYHLAWEAEQKGWPLARPMAFYDEAAISDTTYAQYFWGRDVLVAPVFEQGATTKTVYFPEGDTWVNWYTGAAYEGGSRATLPVSLDAIPFFVREGAILPLRPPFDNIDREPTNLWQWQVYLDDELRAETRLYQDDGHTPAATSKGLFYFKSIQAQYRPKSAQLSFTLSHEGPGQRGLLPEMEQATIVIHGLPEPPTSLAINGKEEPIEWQSSPLAPGKAGAYWAEATQTAYLVVAWSNL